MSRLNPLHALTSAAGVSARDDLHEEGRGDVSAQASAEQWTATRSIDWYPGHFRHAHCAEHQKSGILNKLMAPGPKNHIIFSPTNAPKDPNGGRGGEFSRQRTCILSVEAVFWTRSPRRAWSAKIRVATSLGCNGCVSWRQKYAELPTKPFLQASQR